MGQEINVCVTIQTHLFGGSFAMKCPIQLIEAESAISSGSDYEANSFNRGNIFFYVAQKNVQVVRTRSGVGNLFI